MKLVLGSDHGGFELKEILKPLLTQLGHSVTDMGCYSSESVDYPLIATPVARAVVNGEAERGILICGTGIGVSIAANKINGVRCALCADATSARLTREHNDANILALGGRIIGPELAKDIVIAFLETAFAGSYHARRVGQIGDIEKLK